MCSGRISVVPALDAALPAIGLNGADPHLDGQHYPNLLRMAFAHAWSPVAASWLGYAAGIWMRRDDRCNHSLAQNHSAGPAPALN